MSRTTIICTLGAHRSGTSLASRLLNLLGVYLGPDERVRTARDDNPEGFWEYRPIVDLNDEILDRFGGNWSAPPAFPDGWVRDRRLDDVRARAAQLIDEDFAARPVWGWKDPRTSVTLPFWQDVAGPMRYVMCVRSPLAVAASLARRDEMTRDVAVRLWLTYMQAALAHTAGSPRLLVFYDDVLRDWPHELQRMASFAGCPDRSDDPLCREAVAGFVRREMCHHPGSTAEVAADTDLPFPAKALYLAARASVAADASPRDRDPLDLLGSLAPVEWDRLATARVDRASLEHQLRTLAADRDDARHELREIHESRAWRLVTRTRNILGPILPGARRRG